MNQDQHPPMNGNDDLAKTLNEGLQFEETPMPGAGPAAPSNSTPPMPPTMGTTPPADDADDMKMPTFDPAAGDPDNEPFTPPVASPTLSAGEPKEDKPAPRVEHPHAKSTKNDTPGKEEPSFTQETTSTGDPELDSLKTEALGELRPLVGKLKLPAKDRFDTYLLIIRSTDDQSLLPQAHQAAKEIEDDTLRAQALLDVIKEIDYFSSKR